MNGFQSMNGIFILLLATIGARGEDDVDKRHESNKAAGLFAFPRVGRAGGGHVVWPFDKLGASARGNQKRLSFGPSTANRLRGLRRFLAASDAAPFDGDAVRRDVVAEGQKRNDASTSGLWFGPRLGRRQKREAEGDREDLTIPWSLVFKEYPKLKNRGGFTPRLGRESLEEDYENAELDDAEEDRSSREHGRRIRSVISMTGG